MEKVTLSDFTMLSELREKRWDALDEAAAIELAITALLAKIRSSHE
jgi:hypothetical protein